MNIYYAKITGETKVSGLPIGTIARIESFEHSSLIGGGLENRLVGARVALAEGGTARIDARVFVLASSREIKSYHNEHKHLRSRAKRGLSS
jgi:hypothetical protein